MRLEDCLKRDGNEVLIRIADGTSQQESEAANHLPLAKLMIQAGHLVCANVAAGFVISISTALFVLMSKASCYSPT